MHSPRVQLQEYICVQCFVCKRIVRMVMMVVVTFSWPKPHIVINCNKLWRQLCFYKLGKGANRRECVKQKIMEHSVKRVACVAWRFCRAGRRSGVAPKFAREARENERRSREKNKSFKLLPPQSPRGFSALARLYYLARPTKTAMLRRL